MAAKKTATKKTAPANRRPAEPPPEPPAEPQFVRLDPEAVLRRYHQRVCRIVGDPMAEIALEAAQMEAMGNGEVLK